MDTEFKDKKTQLRKEMKNVLQKISYAERKKEETGLYQMVSNLPVWKEADLIIGYLFFGEEFSVDSLLEHGLLMGKKIAVPKVMGDRIEFFCIDNLSLENFELKKGIREPRIDSKKGLRKLNPVVLDRFNKPLMLVPGLAFSEKGERLGRGGGFYDRFLEESNSFVTNLYTMGVCFSSQVRTFIPINKYDKLLDKVIFPSI